MIKKFLKLDMWTKAAAFYLYFGFILGKGGAYLGLLIGGFMLLSTRTLWDRWFTALVRKNDILHLWSWALLVSLLYGFTQTAIGLFRGYATVTAFQILVFNLCPVYLFLGVYVGMRNPTMGRHFTRFSAWVCVVYTPIYFLFLQKLNLSLDGFLPGSNMNVLANAGTGSSTLMGLISYEPHLMSFWLPLLVLSCVTIANQERADWVGLIISLAIWGVLAKRMQRVFIIAGILTGIIVFAALIDLKLPAVEGRGGELSARGTVSRMAGAFSPDLAREIGGDGPNAGFYYGTVAWRQHWWANIRYEIGKTYSTMIFGKGYGYPLASLANHDVEHQGTRSPHNILYFCYAYSGLVGVGIFVFMELCLFWVLWRVYKATGIVYGLIYFEYQIVQALFGNSIETPQAGIVTYLFTGIIIAPYFLRQDVEPEVDSESFYLEDSQHLHYPELEPVQGD